jgi:predicted secreted protein
MMGPVSAIVLYLVIWFMVLFIVLPIRLETQGDKGEVEPGTPESAPANLDMWKKARLITWVGARLGGDRGRDPVGRHQRPRHRLVRAHGARFFWRGMTGGGAGGPPRPHARRSSRWKRCVNAAAPRIGTSRFTTGTASGRAMSAPASQICPRSGAGRPARRRAPAGAWRQAGSTPAQKIAVEREEDHRRERREEQVGTSAARFAATITPRNPALSRSAVGERHRGAWGRWA